MRLNAREIHANVGASWPDVLAQLGIGEQYLRNKHGPCPACGGKDRFRFDNRNGRGGFICNQCGAGDGFKLLQLVNGWKFSEARREVVRAAGLRGGEGAPAPVTAAPPAVNALASPPARIHRIRRECCPVEALDDAVAYLESRNLWPLPRTHALRAHASLEYWHEGRSIGRFPALLGEVLDAQGEFVTLHVTYLRAGQKLKDHEPRKILSPLTGREGCAIRLLPLIGDALGVAEGTESALSAAAIHQMSVWAALNTSLLARFDPPSNIKRLVIFPDRDVAGLEAASKLMERVQGKVALEVRPPSPVAKDWNDVLMRREAPHE
jgi:putative DNA primase/helicase